MTERRTEEQDPARWPSEAERRLVFHTAWSLLRDAHLAEDVAEPGLLATAPRA